MNCRGLIAAMRGLRNRRNGVSSPQQKLEAAAPLHVEASRIDELIPCPMDTSSEGILDTLDKDTITYVLSLLDTPSDLARAACVCCSWRRYVIEGKLWIKMCIKFFPEIGRNCELLNHSEGSSGDGVELSKCLEAESSAFELLLQRFLSPPVQRTCIAEPLHASSTDNLPQESVAQTLYPEPEYPDVEMFSYWSSKGRADRSEPEMLTYRLVSDLCVVHNVQIRPFLADFQQGHPIYSSQMVRFRFGYSRFKRPNWDRLLECFLDVPRRADMDEYVWTYVSPTFQMAQEDTLQTFQLPKPTLCIGGIFQIEFIGRVQMQESDRLYYICICNVHVTGRPLSDFKFEGIGKEGQIVLKHISQKQKPSSLIHTLKMRSRRMVLRNRVVVDLFLQYMLDAGLLKEGDTQDE